MVAITVLVVHARWQVAGEAKVFLEGAAFGIACVTDTLHDLSSFVFSISLGENSLDATHLGNVPFILELRGILFALVGDRGVDRVADRVVDQVVNLIICSLLALWIIKSTILRCTLCTARHNYCARAAHMTTVADSFSAFPASVWHDSSGDCLQEKDPERETDSLIQKGTTPIADRNS